MPRRPRQASASGYYHFINRGVNRRTLFRAEVDYEHYRSLLLSYAQRFGVGIVHYCFMSNHTHLLVRAGEAPSISRMAHFLHRLYAYYFCKTHGESEQVFKKHFVLKPIEDERYLLECARYIERNPVRAGMTTDPADHSWSSYRHYASGAEDDLIERNPLYNDLGYHDKERMVAYRSMVMLPRMAEAAIRF